MAAYRLYSDLLDVTAAPPADSLCDTILASLSLQDRGALRLASPQLRQVANAHQRDVLVTKDLYHIAHLGRLLATLPRLRELRVHLEGYNYRPLLSAVPRHVLGRLTLLDLKVTTLYESEENYDESMLGTGNKHVLRDFYRDLTALRSLSLDTPYISKKRHEAVHFEAFGNTLTQLTIRLGWAPKKTERPLSRWSWLRPLTRLRALTIIDTTNHRAHFSLARLRPYLETSALSGLMFLDHTGAGSGDMPAAAYLPSLASFVCDAATMAWSALSGYNGLTSLEINTFVTVIDGTVPPPALRDLRIASVGALPTSFVAGLGGLTRLRITSGGVHHFAQFPWRGVGGTVFLTDLVTLEVSGSAEALHATLVDMPALARLATLELHSGSVLEWDVRVWDRIASLQQLRVFKWMTPGWHSRPQPGQPSEYILVAWARLAEMDSLNSVTMRDFHVADGEWRRLRTMMRDTATMRMLCNMMML